MTSLIETMSIEQRRLVQTYERYPVELESGEGCYVRDTAGKRYLDAITGIGTNALGYRHPRIEAVLLEQAKLLVHTSNLFYHPYQGELADRLCRISGMDRVFFSSTGTEAIETALKAVRAYHHRAGTGKRRLVAVRNSFHGRTLGALAVLGQPPYRAPFEPLAPDVAFVAPNDCGALTAAVTDETAAVVLEPIAGEGGVVPLGNEFLHCARETATRRGALLVADEIQCGLGRTGSYFAIDTAYRAAGVRPDLVTIGKPLACGLPLAATLFTDEVALALPAGAHGTTFGGGPLACRVAIEFLSVVEGLLPHIEQVGAHLMRGVRRLRSRHANVREIRGRGLMIGLELAAPGRPVVERALERGLLVNCTHETVLRLLPPFILSEREADEIVAILDDALAAA
jgi:acetylornithine/N-succinyldiaminopimelate aminotransferase